MLALKQISETLLKNARRQGTLVKEVMVKKLAHLEWKRALGLERKEVLGLDIGSSHIKLIQLRKDNSDYTVVTAAIADIPPGKTDDEKARDINTAVAIHQCLKSAELQTRLAVCGLSGPEVAVRYFKFPSLSPEEIEGAVLLEAAQICPFNTNDGAVDYQLVSNGDDNVSGILVAATNKLIKRKTQFIENASLDCVLMDIDGLALLNCLNEYGRKESGQTATAVLNVGSSYTTLAIMGENMPFIRDMTYAGDDIIKKIADENNISAENAAKILSDSENQTQSPVDLGDSLAGACQPLIVDVTETLRYYTTQEKSAPVKKIFVCGGFALVKGFVEILDSHLPAETLLWNPFDKISCDPQNNCRDILEKKGPAMAVAAGLAMRSF